MAEYDPTKSTTTNLSSISAFSIGSAPLEHATENETLVYFNDAARNFAYYKKIPQLKQSVDSLAMWTAGKGFSTILPKDKKILERLDGWGEDTIDSILENMIVVKKIIGNSFAEIIRDDDGQIINLKPISPERIRIVVSKAGRIVRYEHYQGGNDWKPIDKQNIFHLCEKRIGDEIRGNSIIDSVKFMLDAKEEAMDIYRKIMRRSLAMGVLYIDSDDSTQISAVIGKVKSAAKNSEMLALPMNVAEIRDSKVTVQNFTEWINYLDNTIQQALGVPRIILGGAAEYTEASSKVGYLTFEQVYMAEQRKLEQDIWNQLAIRIKFERPVSLKDNVAGDEAKNTGQLGIQPNETQASFSRAE